ncbi:MAG TPA: hypothetical protein VF572_00730 [Candidatus Saccharimonadales bacterium]|jgi:pimeloyl-ACP methyl ester carboxylesterase
MSVITHPFANRYPGIIRDTAEPPTVAPDQIFPVEFNGYTSLVALYGDSAGGCKDLAVSLPGWNATLKGQYPYAYESAGLSNRSTGEGTVTAVFTQPATRLPRNPKELLEFREHLKRSAVGEQRARVAAAVVREACFRLQPETVHLEGHSTGAIDAINVAVRGDGFEAASVGSINGAGQLDEQHFWRAFKRARGAACKQLNGPLPQFHDSVFGLAAVGIYALRTSTEDGLTDLHDAYVPTFAVDGKLDTLYGTSDRSGYDAHDVIEDGHPCHQGPAHPYTARLYAAAAHDLRAKAQAAVRSRS